MSDAQKQRDRLLAEGKYELIRSGSHLVYKSRLTGATFVVPSTSTSRSGFKNSLAELRAQIAGVKADSTGSRMRCTEQAEARKLVPLPVDDIRQYRSLAGEHGAGQSFTVTQRGRHEMACMEGGRPTVTKEESRSDNRKASAGV